MKKNGILILVICSLAMSAQDSLRLRKFSWGLSYSPDVCYRMLKYRTSTQWIEDRRNSRERPRFGFTLGINVNRSLSEKLDLNIGLHFSDKGEKTRWIALDWTDSDGDLPARSRTVFHYQYLDLPLKINYSFPGKKTRLFVSAGISANFFIRQRTVLELEYENGKRTRQMNNEQEIYSDVNLAFICGAGISHDLTKRLTLRVEPVYRQSIIPVLANVPDKEYLYSVGLNMSVYLRLKSKRK